MTLGFELDDVGQPIDVLLLGCPHFDNPGRDAVNAEVPDVLTAHRQRELEHVVDGLSRFEPTVVAVERPHGRATLHADYQAYQSGGLRSHKGEDIQIGFRLANTASCNAVHGIDDAGNVDDVPDFEQLLSDPIHQQRWDRAHARASRAATTIERLFAEGTVADVLRFLNSPEERAESAAVYFDELVPISAGANWAGPDLTARWIGRNLRIVSIIHRITGPGDRLVVVIGAGHVPMLELALRGPRFRLADPLRYLPGW